MKSSEAIPLYIVRFMRLDDYPDEASLSGTATATSLATRM